MWHLTKSMMFTVRFSQSALHYRRQTPHAHLCQVSPVRGSAARPAAAGKRSSLHDSCTRSRRSHSLQIGPLTKPRRIRKSSRVGIFLGTLQHLTPGILVDSLYCSLTANWVTVLNLDGAEVQWSDDEFKHLTNVSVGCSHYWLG